MLSENLHIPVINNNYKKSRVIFTNMCGQVGAKDSCLHVALTSLI